MKLLVFIASLEEGSAIYANYYNIVLERVPQIVSPAALTSAAAFYEENRTINCQDKGSALNDIVGLDGESNPVIIETNYLFIGNYTVSAFTCLIGQHCDGSSMKKLAAVVKLHVDAALATAAATINCSIIARLVYVSRWCVLSIRRNPLCLLRRMIRLLSCQTT